MSIADGNGKVGRLDRSWLEGAKVHHISDFRKHPSLDMFRPVTVEIGEPIIDRETMKERCRVRVSKAIAWHQRAGTKPMPKRPVLANHEVALFLASEEYIGKLSAASIAGWMARNVTIKTKDIRQPLVPLVVNEMQYRALWLWADILNAGWPLRVVILKARQFGFSTLTQAFAMFMMCRYQRLRCAAIAHEKKATQNVADIWRLMNNKSPHSLMLEVSNSELIAMREPHASRCALYTAERGEIGRSDTTHFIHSSEIAFWRDAKTTRRSIMQTLPDDPGTVCIEESTANGVGNVFHRGYIAARDGKSDFIAMFFPWWAFSAYKKRVGERQAQQIMGSLDPEEKQGVKLYGWTVEQLAWRRATIADKCDGDVQTFHQEYPSNDREAFLVSGTPVFDPAVVQANRDVADQIPSIFRGHIHYSQS